MEKTGKMWGFLSDCKPPPTKKTQHKEDRQESNRNYEKNKIMITNISKELDERLGRP